MQMARQETKERLRRELKEGAEHGAGLVELLDHLEASSNRLGRWDRLSRDERDELSLYCWSLKTSEPASLIPDRSNALWGQFRAARSASRRHAERRNV
jgi:hypothetical protein